MYDAKHVPSQWNDDFHSHPDSAFLLTDVPDVSGKGVDEDHVLWNYEAHYDQADKVQLETLLYVAERVQGSRGQALDWGRGGGACGGLDSVEHEGVIIPPLNPLIAISLFWILCSFHIASINLSRY